MQEQPVYVFIHGRALPGQRGRIFSAFERLLRPQAERNANQTLLAWCEDANDADAFHLVECYRSMDALQANATLPEFGQYMQEVQPLLSGPPAFHMGKPRWVK